MAWNRSGIIANITSIFLICGDLGSQRKQSKVNVVEVREDARCTLRVPRWATQTPIQVGALLFQAIDKMA